MNRFQRRLSVLLPKQKAEIRRRKGKKVVKNQKITLPNLDSPLEVILWDCKCDRISIEKAAKLIEDIVVDLNDLRE